MGGRKWGRVGMMSSVLIGCESPGEQCGMLYEDWFRRKVSRWRGKKRYWIRHFSGAKKQRTIK